MEAAYKLLIAYGEFEESVIQYLPTMNEENLRSWAYTIALYGGLATVAVGGIAGIFAAGILAKVGIVGCAVGGISTVFGYHDPNKRVRDLIIEGK